MITWFCNLVTWSNERFLNDLFKHKKCIKSLYILQRLGCQCECDMNLDFLHCLSILSPSEILEETKHMYLLMRNGHSCHLALQWHEYICPANHIMQREPMSVPSAMSLSHPNLKLHMLFTALSLVLSLSTCSPVMIFRTLAIVEEQKLAAQKTLSRGFHTTVFLLCIWANEEIYWSSLVFFFRIVVP